MLATPPLTWLRRAALDLEQLARLVLYSLGTCLALACTGDDATGPSATVASVVVAPATEHVLLGHTVVLHAMAFDEQGEVVAGRDVRWSSSDAAVASVSPQGTVSAVASGGAIIGATIDGATGTAAVTTGEFALPVLALQSVVPGVTYDGRPYATYTLTVTNRASYPDALFAPAPSLPPCGLNGRASRTWVNIVDQFGHYVYGWCALASAEGLARLAFIWVSGAPRPTHVSVTLIDRQTGSILTSNRVAIPSP